MQSFVEIGSQVLEKILKGFYHIWAWLPSWSCDLDYLYTHWFPLPIDVSYKIWLCKIEWPSGFREDRLKVCMDNRPAKVKS